MPSEGSDGDRRLRWKLNDGPPDVPDYTSSEGSDEEPSEGSDDRTPDPGPFEEFDPSEGSDEYIHDATIANRRPLTVALVALEGPMTGQDLLDHRVTEIADIMSPHTVYTPLHDLHDEGILDCTHTVQSKEYTIADEEAAREILRGAINANRWLNDLYAKGLMADPAEPTDADRLELLLEEVRDRA